MKPIPLPYSTLSTLLLVYTIYYIQYLVCYMVRFWRWKMKMRKYIWRWELKMRKWRYCWVDSTKNYTFQHYPPPFDKKANEFPKNSLSDSTCTDTLLLFFYTPTPIWQNSKGSDTWLKTFFDKILHLPTHFLPFLP